MPNRRLAKILDILDEYVHFTYEETKKKTGDDEERKKRTTTGPTLGRKNGLEHENVTCDHYFLEGVMNPVCLAFPYFVS